MAITKVTTPELIDLPNNQLATVNTDGVVLPKGTATRPASAVDGEFRYNTTTKKVEYYDGSTWFTLDTTISAGQGSNFFNTVLYQGNETSQDIAVNFQPDLVIIKNRGVVIGNLVYDIGQTAGYYMQTYSTSASSFSSSNDARLISTGFSVSGGGNGINNLNDNYVSWNWKAGGAAVTNNDGSVTSQVSANVAAGFSIVTNASPAGAYTWGHGLSKAPELWIHKATDYVYGWETMYPKTFGQSAGSSSPSDWNTFFLNTTAAASTSIFYAATDTVLSSTGWGQVNNFVTYCWHSVPGYSKISSYTGNGSTTGPIVETGFKPAWLMVKRTDATANWRIVDNKRNTTNPRNSVLYPNLDNAEYTNAIENVDFLTTGFQLGNSDTSWNASGGTYLYMAFSE